MRIWRFAGPAVAALALLAATPRSTPGKSPYLEIVARAHVETAPRKTVHRNKREFLEFEVSLDAFFVAREQPAGADRSLEVDMKGRVQVVHDLSCGGEALDLRPGDRVELQGEYVQLPKGKGGLIHFTHAADARPGCGTGGGGGHPGGYLRKVAPTTPTPVVTPPRPADIVPDQPYVGTPSASTSSTAPTARVVDEILSAKKAGATDADLLAKVRAGNARYSLSTADMQKLRAAGVSQEVVEAILRSGRGPASTPSPGAR